MRLYNADGWLDCKHIEEVADRNGINFIIIIGKRQVGKTYNVLTLMLEEDKRFIFMRRVKTELEMLSKNVNSPFQKLAPEWRERVKFESEGEYTSAIIRIDPGEEGVITTRIGTATALSTVGVIRGFNGDLYSDIVFDEFIPEEHIFRVRNERDAFLNAHTTINGNRELEGKPCIRTWLLANSNSLNSGVLDALEITRDVERMTLRGEESRIIKDRGIMILLPDSNKIIEKRKQGGLYKAIGQNSKFARMAYENEFAYNDFSDVGTRPLREYNAYVSVGMLTIYLHKNDKSLYITERGRDKPKYDYSDNDASLTRFRKDFPELKAIYERGRITFQNMALKNYFLTIIKY